MALAGSARRGLDPAADEHLGRELLASAKDREEHAIVVRRIERTDRGLVSAWPRLFGYQFLYRLEVA